MSQPKVRSTDQYHRQLDLVNIEKLQGTTFTVVGAGALGSFIVITLAKMGAEKITVYDDDKVETHNLPVQFYRQSDLGKPKVIALQDLVRDFEGVEIEAREARFDGPAESEILISAVDSLESRREIYERMGEGALLYIDSRAAGNVASIFTLPWDDEAAIRAYEENLADDEVYEAPCTERMTTYIAPVVGGNVAAIVANYCNGSDLGAFKRTLDMKFCGAYLEDAAPSNA